MAALVIDMISFMEITYNKKLCVKLWLTVCLHVCGCHVAVNYARHH